MAKSAPEHHEVTHSDFILKLIKGGTTDGKSVRKAFVEDGRKPRSVDGAIGKLKSTKLIASAGLGKYKLLAKARSIWRH